MAAIFAVARSQAPVARYLRGEGREDEEAPALHYFATDDPEWKYVAVRRTASEPVEFFDVASDSSDKPVARFAFEGDPPEIYAGGTSRERQGGRNRERPALRPCTRPHRKAN